MGFSTFVSAQPLYDAGSNQYIRAGSGEPLTLRSRHPIAQVNAGSEIAPAPGAGQAYQILDVQMVAIGGDAAGSTTVDVIGTRAAGAVKIAAVAVAGLTRSAVRRLGDASAAVLADGASYTPLDANTAITIGKTGSALTGPTHIDVVISLAVVGA